MRQIRALPTGTMRNDSVGGRNDKKWCWRSARDLQAANIIVVERYGRSA